MKKADLLTLLTTLTSAVLQDDATRHQVLPNREIQYQGNVPRASHPYYNRGADFQRRPTCKRCNGDHLFKDCPKNVCFLCQQNGHIRPYCPRLQQTRDTSGEIPPRPSQSRVGIDGAHSPGIIHLQKRVPFTFQSPPIKGKARADDAGDTNVPMDQDFFHPGRDAKETPINVDALVASSSDAPGASFLPLQQNRAHESDQQFSKILDHMQTTKCQLDRIEGDIGAVKGQLSAHDDRITSLEEMVHPRPRKQGRSKEGQTTVAPKVHATRQRTKTDETTTDGDVGESGKDPGESF